MKSCETLAVAVVDKPPRSFEGWTCEPGEAGPLRRTLPAAEARPWNAGPPTRQLIDHPLHTWHRLIRWNAAGQINDFKVMVRPLNAIQLVHQRMAPLLQASR